MGNEIVLILSPEYPPFDHTTMAQSAEASARELLERGHSVEIIARSDDGEEFTHLDAAGNLVYRVSGERSYLFKSLGSITKLLNSGGGRAGEAYAARVFEKTMELTRLWNRRIIRVENRGDTRDTSFFKWAPTTRRLLRRSSETTQPSAALEYQRTLPPQVASVELICCTYDRVDELLESVPSMLKEVEAANNSELSCKLRLVHQNPDLPPKLFAVRPDWQHSPRLETQLSLPPGLPRARNAAIAASNSDLLIFVDDDVVLDPGFVAAHVQAAHGNPRAVGIAGRVRSRIEGPHRNNRRRAVGQIRLSGYFDTNFDSVGSAEATLSVQTPRGANMAFRRVPVSALLGSEWFDASLPGSAHREESTLAVELFRRGLYLVYAPEASVYHFESEVGGCRNRGPLSERERVDHLALDYYFLDRLYQSWRLMRRVGPFLLGARQIRLADGWEQVKALTALHFRGYQAARRLTKKSMRGTA